jgi:hypothetical protein
MNPEDIDRQLFRELRSRSVPPPVDVAQRVLTTIEAGPALGSRLNRWAMTVSAALCGVAACAALTAALSLRTTDSANGPADLVINTYDVEVESLLR